MKKSICFILSICLTFFSFVGCESKEKSEDILLEYTSVLNSNADNTLFYVNDLKMTGTADPCILPVEEENGRICFYLYVTGIKGYYSYDLVSWTPILKLFSNSSDSWQNADFWAPEVIYDDEADLYRMFYSASSKDGYFYITMATAKSPKGPFVQWTGINADGLNVDINTPIYDFSRMDKTHALYEGIIRAIDVSPFVDPVTGEKYLYWCRGWNAGGTVVHSTSEIWGMRMKDWATPDYSTVTRLTEVNRVTPGGDLKKGETSINEGPNVIYKDGIYYLTFSVNPASDKYYSVWQATSNSPLGTFTKIAKGSGGMILGADSTWSYVSGTGHHCFFTVDDELYMAYHAHKYQSFTGYGDRAVAIDRVVTTTNADGEIILHANGPTYSPIPLPYSVSGYKNIASTANVTVSSAKKKNVEKYLTDGIINMHKTAAQPEAEICETSTITLSWNNYHSVRAVSIYNTIFKEKAFGIIDRIEFDCLSENGKEETRVIKDAVYPAEEYETLSNCRPGSALVLQLNKSTEVKEIRITVSVPEGDETVAISEIEVIAK